MLSMNNRCGITKPCVFLQGFPTFLFQLPCNKGQFVLVFLVTPCTRTLTVFYAKGHRLVCAATFSSLSLYILLVGERDRVIQHGKGYNLQTCP